MARLSWSVLAWLGIAGAASTWAAANATESPGTRVPGAFIIECESSQVCESVAKAVEEGGGTVRHTFKSAIFNGLSFQLANETMAEADMKALTAQFTGIKGNWQLQKVNLAPGGKAEEQPEDKTAEEGQPGEGEEQRPEEKTPNPGRRLGRRAVDGDGVDSPWPHLMTHIDKLHKEGYTGNGIKIAVVDSGVNHTHPALGGCFGPGCRVAGGVNFSNQGAKNDTMDCANHGTAVAGILAGYDEATGFVGVAPNATIMAYRVNCNKEIDQEAQIKGWIRAWEDGAQIIASSSIVGLEKWSQSLVATIVARIVAQGVPCIVAAGNDNDAGPFNIAVPSVGRGVTAVTSFTRTRTALDHKGAYSVGDGSEPVEFLLSPTGDLPDAWGNKERPLHDVDADFGDDPDDDLTGARELTSHDFESKHEENCKLSPGDSSNGFAQDLVGRIALIRSTPVTKDCSFFQRARNAIARGAAHIVAWEDKPDKIKLQDYQGVQAIGVTTSDAGQAMARALASGKPVTARGTGRVRIDTGLIALYSAYGPTWELDIKPDFGAPGQGILAPDMGGGYSIVSGTSFAGPLVAGVFALVAEVRGTFDPALLNGLVMSTAEPQSEHGEPISVIQQGGGLVRAWAAAHTTTLIEPRALTFNDVDHRVGTITLQIYNSAETEVTYQLSNLAATTLYALGGGFPYSNQVVDAKADIKLSQSSITVGPRQSVTVDVSAADPQGLDPERLPLWSGWIAINGSDGQNLTIPYLGLGGSLRSALVLDPSGLSIHGNPSRKPIIENSLVIFPNPRGPQKPGPSKDKMRPEGAILDLNVTASFKLVLGSPLVRIDIVPLDLCSSRPAPPKPFEHVQGEDIVRLGRPVNGTSGKGPKVLVTRSLACTPDSIITEFAGVKSIGQLPGYPKEWAGIGQLSGSWTGELDAPWQFAPPGRYKFVARALSITGDAANEADWQTVESSAFSVSYEA